MTATATATATACVALIRRFIKPDRVEDFKAWTARQPGVTAPGFLGKTLAMVDPSLGLPPGLNALQIAGNPPCVTFLMIEHWSSVEAFKAYVPKASTADQDEFEAMPRQRTVLPVVWGTELLQADPKGPPAA